MRTQLLMATCLSVAAGQEIGVFKMSPMMEKMETLQVAEDEREMAAGRLPNAAAESMGALKCDRGTSMAGPFPCRNVDMISVISHQDMNSTSGIGNDIWGWRDPETDLDYAIVGTRDGSAFVRVYPDGRLSFLGRMAATGNGVTVWRDMKVYKDHVYIGADRPRADTTTPDHGMQVYDLRQLRDIEDDAGLDIQPDMTYFDQSLGPSHNIVINEETGYLYIVGGRTIVGGLHIVDIRDPGNPQFVAFFNEDGYVHDAHCVTYRGPDRRYRGKEICACFNEDTVTMVDVDDKTNMRILSRTPYDGSSYVHQGWFTDDHAYMLSNDELDELDALEAGDMDNIFGKALIWDVRDLEDIKLIGNWKTEVPTTDHNMYIRGKRAYLANNSAGLRVLSISTIRRGRVKSIGYFDVYPEDDRPGFVGSWSVYPYLRDNWVFINSRDRGFFLVQVTADSDSDTSDDDTTDSDTDDDRVF